MRGRKTNIQSIDHFKEALKDKGLKATPQRIAVHEAMLALGHASADQVADHIAARGETRVTVASVYNILSQMTGLGFYSQRASTSSKMFFDIITDAHIHLYDSKSQEFKDVMDNGLTDLVNSYLKGKKFKGYKVDYVDIQLVCHPTRKNAKKD